MARPFESYLSEQSVIWKEWQRTDCCLNLLRPDP